MNGQKLVQYNAMDEVNAQRLFSDFFEWTQAEARQFFETIVLTAGRSNSFALSRPLMVMNKGMWNE